MATFFWFFKFLLRLPAISIQKADDYRPLVSFIVRLRAVFVLLAFIIGIGVFGFRWIEDYTWLEAYYMTIITLASVGYAEVRPLSDEGRLFTTFLILFNIGFFTYAVTTLTSLFAGGSFAKLIKELRMTDQINNLKNHTVICGYGRHGSEVADELKKQNIPYVIVEHEEAKIEGLMESNDHLFYEGSATEDATLLNAGIERAKTVVLTLPDTADNLFIIYSVLEYNPNIRIISRANDARDERKLRKAGAHYVVMPERLGGFYMASLTKNPYLVEFFTLLSNMDSEKVFFEEIVVKNLQGYELGKTVGDYRYIHPNINLIALRLVDGTHILNPDSQIPLHEDMQLIFLGGKSQISTLKKSDL